MLLSVDAVDSSAGGILAVVSDVSAIMLVDVFSAIKVDSASAAEVVPVLPTIGVSAEVRRESVLVTVGNVDSVAGATVEAVPDVCTSMLLDVSSTIVVVDSEANGSSLSVISDTRAACAVVTFTSVDIFRVDLVDGSVGVVVAVVDAVRPIVLEAGTTSSAK